MNLYGLHFVFKIAFWCLLLLLLLLQAKLRVVPWDGYLKYYNLGEKHPQLIEKRRKVRDWGGVGGVEGSGGCSGHTRWSSCGGYQGLHPQHHHTRC